MKFFHAQIWQKVAIEVVRVSPLASFM